MERASVGKERLGIREFARPHPQMTILSTLSVVKLWSGCQGVKAVLTPLHKVKNRKLNLLNLNSQPERLVCGHLSSLAHDKSQKHNTQTETKTEENSKDKTELSVSFK